MAHYNIGYSSIMRRSWNKKTIAQLRLLAKTMNIEQLADEYLCCIVTIRRVCNQHSIQYKKLPTGRRRKQTLSAQESLSLFKNRYFKEPINQLITTNWILR